MSENKEHINPFKIIKSTELPPEDLKKEVMTSVKNLDLLFRLVQLFIGDYAQVLFESFSKTSFSKVQEKQNAKPKGDLPK